jgi:hypothetical protein
LLTTGATVGSIFFSTTATGSAPAWFRPWL